MTRGGAGGGEAPSTLTPWAERTGWRSVAAGEDGVSTSPSLPLPPSVWDGRVPDWRDLTLVVVAVVPGGVPPTVTVLGRIVTAGIAGDVELAREPGGVWMLVTPPLSPASIHATVTTAPGTLVRWWLEAAARPLWTLPWKRETP